MFGWPKLTTTGFLLLVANAVEGRRILDENRETISSKLNQYLCRGGCLHIFRSPLQKFGLHPQMAKKPDPFQVTKRQSTDYAES
jgi:hypothetical protein